jgi:thioredoxin reductase (NADPH)
MIKMASSHHRLIILGAGPAGYTAAIYAARANLNPVIITGIQPGGQLMTTTEVGNWPGGEENLQGPALMELMQNQITRLGVQIIYDQVEAVQFNTHPLSLKTGSGEHYTCDALIIATGAQAKYLGLPSEESFKGRGVSACATCDGFLYRNQIVAVVGGGNTALEEALYLSNIAARTILIHRRDTFRAEKILQHQLQEKVKQGHISLQLNHIVDEIEGDKSGVTAVRVKHVHTHEKVTIPVQCVFIAIGHRPNTDIFAGQLALKDGYIELPNRTSMHRNATATTVPGVFAAGDVADPTYRQAVTAAATGCMAALDAEKYLDSLNV